MSPPKKALYLSTSHTADREGRTTGRPIIAAIFAAAASVASWMGGHNKTEDEKGAPLQNNFNLIKKRERRKLEILEEAREAPILNVFT